MMLKLKIPPVVVFFICLGLIWGINQWTLIEGLRFQVSTGIISMIVTIGVIVGVLSLAEFWRNSTTANSHKPEKTSSLVTSGVYMFSRNPMYMALLIVLIAAAFRAGSLLGFLVLPLFVFYINHFQIKPEEEVMEEKFGDEFIAYKENVNRWF